MEKAEEKKDKRTMRAFAAKVKKDPTCLARLKGLDEDMAAFLIASGSRYFEYLPEELKTVDACACGMHARSLEHVPERFRTAELYWKACERFPDVIEILPDSEKTDELCADAFRRDLRLFRFFPEVSRTAERCRLAVAQEAWLFEYVPEPFRTEEMCWQVCSRWGWNLKFVPNAFRTRKLCMAAVLNHAYALTAVPDDMLDDEFIEAGSLSALFNIVVDSGSLPRRFWEKARRSLEALPVLMSDREALKLPFYEKYGLTGGSSSETEAPSDWDEPDKELTPENWLEEVSRHGWKLEEVPEEHRTRELCEAAMEIWPNALQDVPERFRTPSQYEKAVREEGLNLELVPEELKTAELCLAAVKNRGTALEYVPEELKTEELCLAAAGRDLDALNFFPAHLREGSVPVRALTAAIQAEQPISLKDCKDAISSAPFWLAMTLKGWPSSGIPEHVPFAPYKLIKAKE